MRTDFRTVKEDLRKRMLDGVWPPGTLLPNELDLAAEFGCARATVNRAMRELAEEGLVERKRKAGTRVRQAPLRRVQFEVPIVAKEVEAGGSAYRYAMVRRIKRRAPDWLRARLQLAEGTQVLHLVAMHYADATPYQLEDRWINLSALPQAAEVDFDQMPPHDWLVSAVPFSEAEIGFSATSADEDTAEYLGCAKGTALFLAERTTWWEAQALTYVRLTYRHGYRMSTRY